ncbi:MAG: NHL repeat-containing protein [Fimbriimonadaceae bacterium]|nr:NHL repeat-containing protein [Fimbriimonadaceae bacterium]
MLKPLRTLFGLAGALLMAATTLAQGELLVTGFARNKVYGFDAATGVATRTIGSAAAGLSGASGLAVDDQNRLYVANQTSGRIMRFFLTTGAVDATFNVACTNARDLLIGPDGNVWALTGTQVRRFSQAGADLGNYLSGGTLKDGFEFEIGPDGKIYICDWAPNHSTERNVKRYLSTGVFEKVFIPTLGTANLKRPNGILWDASGNVYVSDAENNRVPKFNSAGTFISIFCNTGASTAPYRLKWGPDNNLYIVCNGTKVVKKFQGPSSASPGAFVTDFVTAAELETGSADYLLFTAGPSGAITGLCVEPSAVVGGFVHTTGVVTLANKAPAGGQVVQLSSSDTTAATVPASITIAAGKKAGTFLITSRRVTSLKNVTISATVGNQTQTDTLTVLTLIKSLTLCNPIVKGGNNLYAIVELNIPAPSSTSVAMSSANTNAATVGIATLIIPAGSMSGVVEVSAKVVTADTTVAIRGVESGTTVTQNLLVQK